MSIHDIDISACVISSTTKCWSDDVFAISVFQRHNITCRLWGVGVSYLRAQNRNSCRTKYSWLLMTMNVTSSPNCDVSCCHVFMHHNLTTHAWGQKWYKVPKIQGFSFQIRWSWNRNGSPIRALLSWWMVLPDQDLRHHFASLDQHSVKSIILIPHRNKCL